MDGRGRAFDNIFVERLWRSVKYEEVYLKEYNNVREAVRSLGEYFRFYNLEDSISRLGTRPRTRSIPTGRRTTLESITFTHKEGVVFRPKVTIREDADHLRKLDPFIGDLPLESVHMGTMQPFIDHRKAQGRKNRTINYSLQTVRHVLNLAASEWIDERDKTWLQNAPKIRLLPDNDKREPYPVSWEEQFRLFN